MWTRLFVGVVVVLQLVSGQETLTINGIFHDVRAKHVPGSLVTADQDFGIPQTGLVTNLLLPDLDDATGLPVQNTANTQGNITFFSSWFQPFPLTNVRVDTPINLTTSANDQNNYVLDSTAFYPIDGQGFISEPLNDPEGHNLWWTMDLESGFVYTKGLVLNYRSSDDMWIYINNKLAVDIGGTHNPIEKTLNLDSIANNLGLTPGVLYNFKAFFADRNTTKPNIKITIPNSRTVSSAQLSVWETGECLQFKIVNRGVNPTRSWSVTITPSSPLSITSSWNADLTNLPNGSFRLDSAQWNSVIPPGEFITQPGLCGSFQNGKVPQLSYQPILNF